MDGSVIGIIVGSIGGAVLIALVIIAILVIGFFVYKRKTSRNEFSTYSDMIGSVSHYEPDLVHNTQETEDSRFVTPGLVEV